MNSHGRARADVVLGSQRNIKTVGVVAGMCGFYASIMSLSSDLLIANAEHAGATGTVGVLLGAVASVFIAIAIYVAAIVISNAVDTVITGRLRDLAVLRLLGAETRALRAAVIRGCALVAALGAVIGVVAGAAFGDVTRVVLVARGSLRRDDYAWFPWPAVASALVIVLAATIAAWVGSRAVLRATPAHAVRGSSAPVLESHAAGRLRRAAATALTLLGSGILVGAAVLGEQNGPSGMLMVSLGSMVSVTGLLVGARLVAPWLVARASRLLGADPPSALAARNAVRDPSRTTRSTMGLVIGVALVTTFLAGSAALRSAVRQWHQPPAQAAQVDEILRTVSVIMVCVVIVSAAIAAVGFVSTMSLSVIQRTREIGLLRALGFTGGQVRTMVVKESLAVAATAVIVGMVLGIILGAAGAQSLVGSRTEGFVWGVPGGALAAVGATGVLLVLAASLVPSARAVAIAPVEALRTVG